MSDETAITSTTAPSPQSSYIIATYTEVCRSHEALQNFRMKLLGLLPIASIAALLALEKSASSPAPTLIETAVIGYIGVFSALFTLALFGYEARGILMCHDLYATGAALERVMAMNGQFTICDETRDLPCYDREYKRGLARKINSKIAPCAVYSLVFAAWSFVALRFVFNVHLNKCALWAGGAGILLAVVTSTMFHVLTTPSKRQRVLSMMKAAV
jgi:hypothetical protein